jgi:hypothetical protein
VLSGSKCSSCVSYAPVSFVPHELDMEPEIDCAAVRGVGGCVGVRCVLKYSCVLSGSG